MVKHRNQQQRLNILDSYYQTIARDGFGVSVRELAAHSRKSTYVMTHYFGNKVGMFGAVIDRVVEHATRPFDRLNELTIGATAEEFNRELTEGLRADSIEEGGHRILVMKQHIGSLALTDLGRESEIGQKFRQIGSDQLAYIDQSLLRLGLRSELTPSCEAAFGMLAVAEARAFESITRSAIAHAR